MTEGRRRLPGRPGRKRRRAPTVSTTRGRGARGQPTQYQSIGIPAQPASSDGGDRRISRTRTRKEPHNVLETDLLARGSPRAVRRGILGRSCRVHILRRWGDPANEGVASERLATKGLEEEGLEKEGSTRCPGVGQPAQREIREPEEGHPQPDERRDRRRRDGKSAQRGFQEPSAQQSQPDQRRDRRRRDRKSGRRREAVG